MILPRVAPISTDSYYDGVVVAKSVIETRCEVLLLRMIFNLRLVVTAEPHGIYFEDIYCYHDFETAQQAFETWDGQSEPQGWARHPLTNRRGPGFREEAR